MSFGIKKYYKYIFALVIIYLLPVFYLIICFVHKSGHYFGVFIRGLYKLVI